MLKINLLGNVFGECGFSNHTRQIAKALAQKCELEIETQLPVGWEVGCDNDIFNAINKRMENIKGNMKDAIELFIGHPHLWQIYWNKLHKGFVGFVIFEGSQIPQDWVKYIEDPRVDAVLVPSKHVADACKAAGVKRELHIVSEGVDVDLFKPTEKLDEFKQYDGFTFLFNKGWSQGERDRSGLDLILKTFITTFKDNPKVRLIVKTNASYGKPNAEIAQLLAAYPGSKCPIALVTDNIPFDKMPNLYNSADCFLAPAKAEGFGLNIAEAMACELPVIATGYGGHTDFLTDDIGFKIKYKMAQATDNNIIYEDAKWAMPDMGEFSQRMDYCVKHKDDIRILGEKSRKKIEENFTWNHSADKIMKALTQIF